MSDVEGKPGARAESDGIESFIAMFVDMHGKPRRGARRRHRRWRRRQLCGRTAGPEPGGPRHDRGADPASDTVALWQPGLAVLQRDINVDGSATADPEGGAGEGAGARPSTQCRVLDGTVPACMPISGA